MNFLFYLFFSLQSTELKWKNVFFTFKICVCNSNALHSYIPQNNIYYSQITHNGMIYFNFFSILQLKCALHFQKNLSTFKSYATGILTPWKLSKTLECLEYSSEMLWILNNSKPLKLAFQYSSFSNHVIMEFLKLSKEPLHVQKHSTQMDWNPKTSKPFK